MKSKVYAYKAEKEEIKKLKGCSKAIKNKGLYYDDYN